MTDTRWLRASTFYIKEMCETMEACSWMTVVEAVLILIIRGK